LIELVDQKAVRAMHLNAIEARSNGIFCGGGVCSNVLLDFICGERAWYIFPFG